MTMGVFLPFSLPISLNGQDVEYGITLPTSLPFSLANDVEYGISLPVSLPFSLASSVSYNRKSTSIKYKEHINLNEYHGVTKVKYKESLDDNCKTTSIAYKEKAWYFPGLIIEENVITKLNSQVTINENIQALILVDFELSSPTELSFKWYNHSVPSFDVMIKAAVDENYESVGSYSWNASSGKVTIGTDSYNIYLRGASNSGSSQVYTIGDSDSSLVIPDIQISTNNKYYTADIDYTSVYKININY